MSFRFFENGIAVGRHDGQMYCNEVCDSACVFEGKVASLHQLDEL
ncbi:MAG: hypothetical protein K0S58_1716 [Nitrospira sp.]|jgi:hypothetical protein|nr:hypothetical protein [Nitrospira sp.]